MDPVLSHLTLRDAGTALLDLAMPRHCIVCRRPLGLRERFICLECQAGFPFTHFWERSHNPMADKLNALIQQDLDALIQQDLDASAPHPPDTSTQDSSVPASSLSPSDHTASSLSAPALPEPSLPDPSLSAPGVPPCPPESPPCPPERSEGSSPREPYAFAAALFFYNADSGYRRIPWHLKYEGGLAAGRHFARLLGARLAASPQFADVDVVIPVPLHWTRRWRRGYNQVEVIARELADVLGAELRTDILRRSRRTRSQVRLSLAGKAANVRGAFSIRRSPARYAQNCHNVREEPAGCAQNCHNVREKPAGCARNCHNVRAGHVLLVDDTFTTGSTLNACRAVLRQAFPPPTRISIATLAYVSSE